jgi:inner membrane protein
MTAPTHLAFAAFNGVVLASFQLGVGEESLGWNIETMASALALSVGALTPDLDSPGSFISRALPPARLLHRRLTHRGLLHSLAGLALVTLALFVPLRGLIALFKIIGVNLPQVPVSFFVVGYLSHLIADCLTVRGVKFFYPYPIAFAYPTLERYRLQTGNRKHELAFSGASLLATLFFLPVLHRGGAEATLHHALASIHAAREDYHQIVGQEALLSFNGYFAVDKQPVSGEAPILELSATNFIVFFQNQVMEIGESSGQIIATSALCQPTGRPVAVTQLTVTHDPWSAILKLIPAGVLVSGELTADHPFKLIPRRPDEPNTRPTITASGQSLRLDYAQLRQLAGLHIEPRTNSDELSAEIETLQSSLTRTRQEIEAAVSARNLERNTYERDRLYSQITALRKRETDLKTQIERRQNEQETARQRRIFFSGTLSLRTLFVNKTP